MHAASQRWEEMPHPNILPQEGPHFTVNIIKYVWILAVFFPIFILFAHSGPQEEEPCESAFMSSCVTKYSKSL
jgi:hypothetical protein